MQSILKTIKKLLLIEETDTDFDTDIIVGINTVMMVLTQMGVGPKEGFSISDDSTTWEDYIGNDLRLESIKTYIHLRVKLLFDPPESSSASEAINRMISELEWRLYTASGQY